MKMKKMMMMKETKRVKTYPSTKPGAPRDETLKCDAKFARNAWRVKTLLFATKR